MLLMKTRKTTNALEILDDRYFKGRPAMQQLLRDAEERLRLAIQLHELREREGMTQQEVADLAGTSRSVIARLEQPGYDKHTMSTLRKIAGALGYSMRIEFTRLPKSRASKGAAGAG